MIKPWLQLDRTLVNTPHAAIVTLGLFIGLCYLPNWLYFLLYQITSQGSGSLTLAVCLVVVGGTKLWQQRHHLAPIQPLPPDRWLGDCLIVAGIFLFPFWRFALWSQALLWLMILGGMAISCWGLSFFGEHPGISWAFALSAYPNPGHIISTLWQTLLPNQALEISMAWMTTVVLHWLGQPVIPSGRFVLFPNHTITIGWGCSGFDMALAMIGASLLLGLYLRFSGRSILFLSCIGIALAFLFNIPRLVFMALAAVYWGNDIFDFWHGPLGGQVFVVPLFIGYFYCVLSLTPTAEDLV